MNNLKVDGVIKSLVDQLVEVLEVPAKIAWQSAIEYVRIDGYLHLIPIVIAVIILVSFVIFGVCFEKDDYKDRLKKWSEAGSTEDKPTFGVGGLFGLTLFGVVISYFSVILSKLILLYVFQILYPEPMLIYRIFEKMF